MYYYYIRIILHIRTYIYDYIILEKLSIFIGQKADTFGMHRLKFI